MSGYKSLLAAILAFPFAFFTVVGFALWAHALILAAHIGWSLV